MDKRSVALTNLNTGEVFDTGIKLPDNKFIKRGYKMYNLGIDYLIDVLTKKELKATMALFGTATVDKFNILIIPFRGLTANLDTSARSKFKRKLIENSILGEYKGKLMLNPSIFIPKGTKDIRNCNYLTQQVWTYMFNDCTKYSPDTIEHAEVIFGDFDQSDFMLVGSGKHSKLLSSPKENT